jgi:uncharacterized protein
MGLHQSHKSIVNRLQRAKGHLESVIEMIRDEKPCLEVSQQLHAVCNALHSAKQVYVKDHIDHCFDDSVLTSPKELKTAISEFKGITKYLE